jgi:hypothetical protein
VPSFCSAPFLFLELNKVIRALALTISLTLATSSSFATPRILKEQPLVQKAGLFVYLENQCELYLRVLKPNLSYPLTTVECVKATKDFVSALDLPGRDHVSRAVVFKTELLDLLKNPKTTLTLKALRSSSDLLKIGIQLESAFDVIRKVEGRTSNVVRFIAVLFQDTSGDMYHMQWATLRPEFKTNRVFHENTLLISDLIERINGVNGAKLARSFYPSFVRTIEDNNFYHLYVIAHLTQLMRAKGNGRAVSFLLPFTMNYGYEALEQESQKLAIITSDVAFRDKSSREDLLLAYMGGIWTLGKIQRVVNRDGFHTIFRDNKRSGSNFKELLRRTIF